MISVSGRFHSLLHRGLHSAHMTHSQKRRRRAGSAALHEVDDLRVRSRSLAAADRDGNRLTVSEHISARPAGTMLIALGAGFLVAAAILLRRSS